MWSSSLFLPQERLVQRITLVAGLLAVLLCAARGTTIDVGAYAAGIGLPVLMIAMGLGYRLSGRDARIGSTLVCAGHFIAFTLMLSLFNYALTPHWAPTIDVALARYDEALFGYRWPDFVAASAQHPLLNEMMRYAYLSTLPQIAILVAWLGLSGRLETMLALMTTVVLTGTIAVVFWGVLPSLGPSALFELPAAVKSAASPVVDSSYGRQISDLFLRGTDRLAPNDIRGLIAFPSYHIVLALAVTWYSRTLRYGFPIFLVVNLLVLPGVLVHGGHHLLDIPAGCVLFACVVWLTRARASEASAAEAPEPRLDAPSST